MKNTLFLLLVLWGATLPAQNAQQLLNQAIALSEKGKYVASNDLLDKLISEYPTRKYDLSEAELLKSENHLALGNYEYAKRANNTSLQLHQEIIPEDVGRNLLQAGIIAAASADYEEALELLSQAEGFPFIDAPATPAEIKFLKSIIYSEIDLEDLSVDALTEGRLIEEVVGEVDKARGVDEFEALLQLRPSGIGSLNSMELPECINWYLLSKITYEKAKSLKTVYISKQDEKALSDAYKAIQTSIDAFEQYAIYLSPPTQHKYLTRESKYIYNLGIELSLLLNEADSKNEYAHKAYELAERSKRFEEALKLSDQGNREKGLEYKARYHAAMNQLALNAKEADRITNVLEERKAYIEHLDSVKKRSGIRGMSNGNLITLQDMLDKKQLVFYYYNKAETAYMLMVTKSDSELKVIPEPERLRHTFQTYNFMTDEQKDQSFCMFYNQLIAPFEKAFRSTKTLYIDAPEAFTIIPFEALVKECSDKKNIRKWTKRLTIVDISILATPQNE
jgi:hypothetical protein